MPVLESIIVVCGLPLTLPLYIFFLSFCILYGIVVLVVIVFDEPLLKVDVVC